MISNKEEIERSSIVGDSSEIFKVDENTGELVSIFAKLRPGMGRDSQM